MPVKLIRLTLVDVSMCQLVNVSIPTTSSPSSLKKTESLGSSDYDRIFKMHVYTLAWLKLDRIGFLTVGLKHLDYSIDSRITHACIHSIKLDSDFEFCAGSRFFSWGHESEVEGQRKWWQRWRLSSKITTSKSATVHLVNYVIIMYTIYKMYKM